MKNKYIIFLTSVIFSVTAWSGSISKPSDVHIKINENGPRDTRPGTGWVLKSSKQQLEYKDINCPITLTATVEGGQLVPGYTDRYQTGIPSVGIRLASTVNPGDTEKSSSGYISAPFTQMVNISGTGSFTLGRGVGTMAVTGYAEAGTVDPSILPVLKTVYSGSCIDTVIAYAYVDPQSTFKPYTCSVSSSNILVNLGTIPRDQFRSIGSTSPEVDFDINLECDFSYKYTTGIYITFTDDSDNNSVNTSNTLPLDNQSTAKGLGVQILHQGSPILFGPDSSFSGTQNQILLEKLNPVENGSINYNFQARYISTGPVSAGTANTRATFTMSYQ